MARRSGQSGSVALAGDTSYGRFRVDVPGQEGRVRKAVPLGSKRDGMTKPMARMKLRQLLDEKGVNSEAVFTQTVQPGPLFRDVAEWWAANKLSLCAPSYQETRGAYLKTHLLPYFGTMPVCVISERVVQEFVAHLSDKRKLLPATVASVVSKLKSILGGKATRDWQLRMPPSNGEEPRFFTPDEMLRIVSAARGRDKVLYALLGETGLRFGEAAGLRPEDLDLGAGTVTVRRSVYRGKDQPTKSRAGMRIVNVSQGLVQLLREHLSGRVGERVFETRSGRPLAKDASRHSLHRLLARLGIKKGGLHSFRHGRVSMLQAAGVAPDLIRSWVGHASSRITSRYTHFGADYKQAVAEQVGLFSNGGLNGLNKVAVTD